MSRRTLDFELNQGFLVLVHSEEDPDPTEFEQYLSFATQAAPRLRGLLVVTDGGAPNAKQRGQIDEKITRLLMATTMTAVVSPSTAARLVVNLMGLTGTRIRAFRADAVDDALKFLGATGTDAPIVRESVARLQQRLRAELAKPRSSSA